MRGLNWHREAYAVCRYCGRAIETMWDSIFNCDVWVTSSERGKNKSYCQARASIQNPMIGQRVSHEPTDLGVTYIATVRPKAKSPAAAVLGP